MVLLTEVILIFVAILTISDLLRIKKYSLFTLIYIMYIVIYVLPVVFYWLFGIPDYGQFHGYNIALNDEVTAVIYNVLILLGLLLLYRHLKKSSYNQSLFQSLKKINIKNKEVVIILLLIIIILPVFVILLSPNPENYLTTLGYFSSPNFSPAGEEIAYRNQFTFLIRLCFLAFVLLRLLYNNRFLNIYIYTCLGFWLLFENKRTSFALLIFALAFIDTTKKELSNNQVVKKFMIAGLIVIIYFIIYSAVSGKQSESMSALDQIRQYFFRDADLKLAIYGRLNENHYHLLEYNGQSILYNLLFFVPRMSWPDKPWPYDVYATSAALGYNSFIFLNWNVQVSWISELYANFGIVGFYLAIMSYVWLDKKIQKINNTFFSFFVFYYLVKMSLLGFNSAQLDTLFLIIFIFVLSLKSRTKKKRIVVNPT